MKDSVLFDSILFVSVLMCLAPACDEGSSPSEPQAPPAADEGDASEDGGSTDDGEASLRCDEETRDDFAIGVMREGAVFGVTIMDAMPADPIRGDNRWTIAVQDAAGAVDEVEITVRPWMPDHNHGTAVPTFITAMGAGQFELAPVNMFMAGLWEVHLDLTAGDRAETVTFYACVE